jgi:hypothetical protein
MVRWTLTTRDGGKVHAYESNAVIAYKKAVEAAEQSIGGGIITVDDLETSNSLFHTEAVSEKASLVC